MASISDAQMMQTLDHIAEIARRQNEAEEAINDLAGVVRICLERIANLDSRVAKAEEIP